MKGHIHEIAEIVPGSIAEECGLIPGDKIISINGHQIEDIFDYQFYIEEEYLSLLVETGDGEEYILEIEKDEEEDLGILFQESLMDQYHSCTNKCIFCFIDQMPPGMRETLYFKDDDSRLSFLQGNYITLTNMNMQDMERIIRYHLAPINISVHTTNPELRCQMLHNRFAGDILEKIRMFSKEHIEMNSQIVLCRGINDGEELERTIRDLTAYLPAQTFFVENLYHGMTYKDEYTKNLLFTLLLTDEIEDVRSDPAFPQFHATTNKSHSVFAAFDHSTEGFCDSGDTALIVTNLSEKYPMKLLGIECAFVPCTPMGHAWDLVKIDGSWYHVDVTADLDYKKIPGSVYHKFFMLSDAALAETDHYGWTVVHEADNTSYDNSFWRDVSSGIFYRDGYWYYSDNDYSGRNPECVICRRDASNGVTDILVRNIGTWSYSQDGFNFYQRLGMAKLFLYGDRIYYSAPKGIYSAKLDGTDVTKVYTPVTDGSYTYVFGLANSGEKAVYSVFKFPYEAVDYIGEFDLPHLADSNKLHFLSFDGTPAVALTDDEITEGKIFAAAYNEDKTECLQVISEEITDKRLYYFEFSADGYSSVKYMLFDGLMPIAKPVETVK